MPSHCPSSRNGILGEHTPLELVPIARKLRFLPLCIYVGFPWAIFAFPQFASTLQSDSERIRPFHGDTFGDVLWPGGIAVRVQPFPAIFLGRVCLCVGEADVFA